MQSHNLQTKNGFPDRTAYEIVIESTLTVMSHVQPTYLCWQGFVLVAIVKNTFGQIRNWRNAMYYNPTTSFRFRTIHLMGEFQPSWIADAPATSSRLRHTNKNEIERYAGHEVILNKTRQHLCTVPRCSRLTTDCPVFSKKSILLDLLSSSLPSKHRMLARVYNVPNLAKIRHVVYRSPEPFLLPFATLKVR
jgi:hypothetical protein